MKKSLIITALLLITVVVGAWLFFTYGGKTTAELSNEQQAILELHDQRLSKGSPGAPVKIIEYIDVLCPFCAQASQPGGVISRMIQDYVDTGKVYYEVRLAAQVSPDSMRAGQGAYCAAEQDKFWDYIDKAYADTWQKYYSQNKQPSDVPIFQADNIYRFVQSIPTIDRFEWRQCMNSNSYAQTIDSNHQDMQEFKAYGTPTMVIDGKSYTGTPPYSTFQAVIDASLKESKDN